MSEFDAKVVPFTGAQKEYLEGYAAGLRVRGLLPVGAGAAQDPSTAAPAAPGGAETLYGVPVDELSREERFKLEENPLDIWDKLLRHAAADQPPEGGDVFRFKFHGLFYVAPAQDSFMVRVRVPGNVITSVQLHALARIARSRGNGHGDVTTRGNIQLREFAPRDIVNVLMALAEAGWRGLSRRRRAGRSRPPHLPRVAPDAAGRRGAARPAGAARNRRSCPARRGADRRRQALRPARDRVRGRSAR